MVLFDPQRHEKHLVLFSEHRRSRRQLAASAVPLSIFGLADGGEERAGKRERRASRAPHRLWLCPCSCVGHPAGCLSQAGLVRPK